MANDPNGPNANPPETWLSRAVSWLTTRFVPGVFVTWLSRQAAGPWWGIRYALRMFWACRAAMLSVVIGGALIALTDQARDIVMASAINKDSIPSKIGLIATMLAWAFVSWYWARVTLNFSFALPPLGTDLIALKGAPAPWRKPLAWGIAIVAVAAAVVAILTKCATFVIVALAVVSVLVAFWIAQGVHPDRPQRWQRWWRLQAPRMIGTLAIVAVAVAFWKAYDVYSEAGDATARRFLIWALVFAGLAIAFYLTVAYRAEIMAWFLGRPLDDAGAGDEPGVKDFLIPKRDDIHDRLRDYANPFAIAFLLLSLLASPFFFVWFVLDPIAASAFFGGAVRAILFGLATLVPVLSLLVLLSARTRLPLIGATVFWMAMSGVLAGDNHQVRTLKEPAKTTRPSIDQVFVDWWTVNSQAHINQEMAPDLTVPPMIMVATAGGASRAAYWTSQVLGEIAVREKNFTDRVFLISGVSGGSLGATAFRSQVVAHRAAKRGALMDKQTPAQAKAFLTQDFLTPAMATGLYVDLPLHAFPWWRPIDRAAALEKAWEAAWKEEILDKALAKFAWDTSFIDTFSGKDNGPPWPILALNGSSVEKGKRIITSNIRLRTADDHLAGRLNRYDAFDILEKDIRISTAVTMSARFPIIAPTGGMERATDGDVETRVTDGGLYENFGAATADEVLRYIVERRRDTQPGGTGRTARPVWPIVILISSDPSLDPLDMQSGTGRKADSADCAGVEGKPRPIPVAQPGNDWKECPTDGHKRALTLIDPIASLYSGRTARGEGAATALVHRVTENRVTIRDRILHNIHITQNVPNEKDAIKNATARLATFGLVDDFFHFRQCRVSGRKGPTMSWHDSDAAWEVMDAMLGLKAGADHCGNGAEFFRLCVRLTVLSGLYEKPRKEGESFEEAATSECAQRWEKPQGWDCRPHGEHTVCGFWDKGPPPTTPPSIAVPQRAATPG